ncbi:universal stress protein PHOS34 [Cocos nucifera]|nr:universal stress protein PHOS34 [Cocos nucifera]
MEMAGKKQVVLVAVDESNESMHALEWAVEHLFSSASVAANFKIILIHVKPPPVSILRISGPGMGDVLSIVDNDLKKTAALVTDKAKEICEKRSVTDFEVVATEGDARNVLCEAVEKHHADMLIMGSHGYGTFKRAILGSVSDYCAHHAPCSVLIVKKPKANANH